MDYSTFRISPTGVPGVIFFFDPMQPYLSTVIDVVQLENEAREAQNMIDHMSDPTDEELLEWARTHYPFPNHTEKDRLLGVVEKYTVIKNLLTK